MRYRVHYELYAAGGRMIPTYRVVEADSQERAVAVAHFQQDESDRQRGRAKVGYFSRCRVEELESVNPADVPEKGVPMEASSSTAQKSEPTPDTPEEKKENKPTERLVFKRVEDEKGKPILGEYGGEQFERIGKPCTGSRRESIGDAMDELGLTSGTFMAPSSRSAVTETPGTATKTQRTWG